jgi:ATP-binding cassette subfamily B protein
MAGFERFMEIMNTKPEMVDRECAIEMREPRGNIEFDHVSFGYDNNKNVLYNINFKIDAGRSLALVGPSGGGKTTLSHLLPRFYDVLAGKILIDGIDIRDFTMKSLRNNVGLVSRMCLFSPVLLVRIFCMEIQEPVVKKSLKLQKRLKSMTLL